MSTTQSKRKLRILLIDDDADTRELVTMMIEKAGHKVQTTGHGQAGLMLLEHEKIDIILLDIMMPEVDGLSILESIRKVSQAPVLMLTALSDARIMEQTYLMGADDYIVKPFTMNKLLERIDRIARQLPPPVNLEDMAWSKNYLLDESKEELLHAGLVIALSTNETRVLKRLMADAYMEVSVSELYHAGWGHEMLPARTVQALVENTVRSLQGKIEKDPANPAILLGTEKGFSFNPD